MAGLSKKIRAAVFSVVHYCFYVVMALYALVSYILPLKYSYGFMDITWKFHSAAARWILGVPTEIRGTANMPDGPCLLAVKHQSSYDIVFPFRVCTQPALIGKKELRNVPFFDVLINRMDMITVDREGGIKSMRDLRAKVRREADRGRSIMIFPEGTRSAVDAPPDYKPGVAFLYSDLALPCVPVATNSGAYWVGRKKPTPTGGRIVYDIQKPIPPGLNRRDFMHALEESIETACARLNADPTATTEEHIS